MVGLNVILSEGGMKLVGDDDSDADALADVPLSPGDFVVKDWDPTAVKRLDGDSDLKLQSSYDAAYSVSVPRSPVPVDFDESVHRSPVAFKNERSTRCVLPHNSVCFVIFHIF